MAVPLLVIVFVIWYLWEVLLSLTDTIGYCICNLVFVEGFVEFNK